jgi:hypothetical protein
LARIGSSCLQQLLESNSPKLNEEMWGKITSCFVSLFDLTTPKNLLEFRDLVTSTSSSSSASAQAKVAEMGGVFYYFFSCFLLLISF